MRSPLRAPVVERLIMTLKSSEASLTTEPRTVPGLAVSTSFNIGSGPLLSATFSGRRAVLTSPALLRAFVALPLVTFKIIAAIHWQALRLWLKGARFIPGTKQQNAASRGPVKPVKEVYAEETYDVG